MPTAWLATWGSGKPVISLGSDIDCIPQASQNASVWYYFRELDYERIRGLREIGDTMARAAAMMSNTTSSARVLGSAWPQHFNRPVAEAMDANIKAVGLPQWSEADQRLARALQGELQAPITGLGLVLKGLQAPATDESRTGGSDDIGDVSWVVPTVSLRYPANVPGLPGHNWANAIAMATPIAHKGTTAGAKVLAMTLVDLLTQPELVAKAWDYFRNTQTEGIKYQSLLGPDDRPPTWLNSRAMATHREAMKQFYFNPEKFDTYLEQLGIGYPTVRSKAAANAP
jgi:aminobenzoyl-glutamate utilization protein B